MHCYVLSGLSYNFVILIQALSREVASGQSGHLIPFILMEWTLQKEMSEYAACVDWLLDGGYTPHNYGTYQEYTREEVLTIVR